MGKKKEKVSFLFEYIFIDYLDGLTADETKQILKDMVNYDKYDIEPNYVDRTLKTIWELIKKAMKENKDKYKATCENNKKSQNARWERERAKKEYERIPLDTHEYKSVENSKTYTDIDLDLDSSVCIYNSNENNICHFENKFKIESCKDCSKRYICKNPTDPDFRLKKGCDFKEWLAKHQNFAEQITSSMHDPPDKNDMQELDDYNWMEDD